MTTKELCRTLKVGKTTALRWAHDGCPHQQGPDGLQWNVKQVERWRRETSGSLDALKLRKERLLCEAKELELQRRKALLIDKAENERECFMIASQFRDAAMGIADRLAGPLAAESDQSECHRIITLECRRVCQMLAKQLMELANDPTRSQ